MSKVLLVQIPSPVSSKMTTMIEYRTRTTMTEYSTGIKAMVYNQP
jgi:hypothetical protein